MAQVGALAGLALLCLWLTACGETPPTETPAVAAAPTPTLQITRPPIEPIRPLYEGWGRLAPGTPTPLAAELDAKVVFVSEELYPGRIVAPGTLLVELERSDFELRRIQAHAAVAQARLELRRQEEEAAAVAAERDDAAAPPGNDLAWREPQLEAARAGLDAAQATARQAEIDLRRTRVVSPRRARIAARHVETGQWVARGTPLAELEAADFMELRLSLPPSALAHLAAAVVPPVARITTDTAAFDASLHRIENALDPTTGLGVAVFRLPDPYEASSSALRPGLLVRARVAVGPTIDTFRLPANAVVDDHVGVIRGDGRAEHRRIQIVESRDSWVAVDARDVADLENPRFVLNPTSSWPSEAPSLTEVPWADLGLTLVDAPTDTAAPPHELLDDMSSEPVPTETEGAETEPFRNCLNVLSWKAELQSDGTLELSVELDGDAEAPVEQARIFRLDAPDRWGVDLPGVLHPQAPRRQELSDARGAFLNVRSAQFETSPDPVARWVVTVQNNIDAPTVDGRDRTAHIRFGGPP